MKYRVHILPYKGDYSAMVPDLPGCVAAGSSIEEVRSLIAEAIGYHLEDMQHKRQPIPEPSQHFELDLDELEEGELCTWVDVKDLQLA
jgi:predicted RNase H-like HicB family nuclease